MLSTDGQLRRYLPHGQGLPRDTLPPAPPPRPCGPGGRDIATRPAARATLNRRLLLQGLTAVLLLQAAASPVRAQQWNPPIQKVPHLFLQTEVLGMRGGVTRSLGKATIEAAPGRPGKITLPLELGPSSADHPTSIEIEVTQNEADENKIGLTVVTTVVVASRSGEVARIRRERVAEVDEGRSFFHQAYENAAQETSVLLTMTPESRVVPQLVKPTFSAPIIFNVTLSSITAQGEVPLENNVLRTLENSPVSYSFRIATANAPVEAEAPPDAESAPREPVTAPISEPAVTPAPGNGANLEKSKTTKPKKKSRKEREREALEQFQRSKDTATPSDAAAPPVDDAAIGATGTAEPAEPASPPADAGSPAPALASADELELILLPHRVESGILMVEASLRGRVPGAGGAQRATLVQRTQAVTSNSSFDITVSGMGPSGAGSYRFSVQALF